ncbi:MAG: fucose isomerase, partial [Spirochaetes bacterium]|nr:fucose isomerase [Spirochaetota bacterium]
EPSNWDKYRSIISKFEERVEKCEYIERFEFYKRANDSFLVVATGEPDGNLILKKGVVMI